METAEKLGASHCFDIYNQIGARFLVARRWETDTALPNTEIWMTLSGLFQVPVDVLLVDWGE